MEIDERIIQACQDLIMEYGYRGFSMDALAARSGVSKRTLYRHFRSKDQVVEATLDAFMQDMGRELDTIFLQENDPVKIINNIFTQLSIRGRFTLNTRSLDDLRRYYPHLWVKIDKFRQDRIRHIFFRLPGLNRPGTLNHVDPRILLAVITASIQAVLNPEFIIDNGLTFEDAALQLSRILLAELRGLSAPET